MAQRGVVPHEVRGRVPQQGAVVVPAHTPTFSTGTSVVSTAQRLPPRRVFHKHLKHTGLCGLHTPENTRHISERNGYIRSRSRSVIAMYTAWCLLHQRRGGQGHQVSERQDPSVKPPCSYSSTCVGLCSTVTARWLHTGTVLSAP